MAEIRMTWKVRAILKIYDSFTRRPALLSTLRVTADAGLTAIRKPDGILVFVENHNYVETGKKEVGLESPIFLKKRLSIPMGEAPQVTVVWLDPGEGYPAPPQSARLYGRALPGAALSFVFMQEGGAMKLLSDYRAGNNLLEIYHPGILSLEGYVLELEWAGKRETVAIGKELEKTRPETGAYRIAGAPRLGEYPKMDTTLRIVYHTDANERGMYTFLFAKVPAAEAAGRIEMVADGIKKEVNVSVRDGSSIRLDLVDEEAI